MPFLKLITVILFNNVSLENQNVVIEKVLQIRPFCSC